MAVRWLLTPLAESDIAEAYEWYEGQSEGLGERFIQSVDSCLRGIATMPTMHEVVHKDYRRALVRHFPYVVIYRHDDTKVAVHAIFHTSRKASSWLRRLP